MATLVGKEGREGEREGGREKKGKEDTLNDLWEKSFM